MRSRAVDQKVPAAGGGAGSDLPDVSTRCLGLFAIRGHVCTPNPDEHARTRARRRARTDARRRRAQLVLQWCKSARVGVAPTTGVVATRMVLMACGARRYTVYVSNNRLYGMVKLAP